MQKIILLIYLFLLLSNPVWSKTTNDSVEIYLLNQLDDSRGFCIDIRGHKLKAKIDKGLQAHTCYSYQGKISPDQGFDSLIGAHIDFQRIPNKMDLDVHTCMSFFHL